MALREIIVPESEQSKSFDMTGLSVMVLSAPSYFRPVEAAKISFNDPGDGLPALNRNIYPSDQGEFKKIVITGTEASAGDEITLLTINNCVDPVIDGFSAPSRAKAGNTFTKTMDGSVQQLSDLEIIDAGGNFPKSIYVSSAGGDINYRFNHGGGGDPGVAGSDYVLKNNAEPVEILGVDFFMNIRFINSTASETPDIIITARY